MLLRFVVELKLRKKVLVLISVLQIKLKKVHRGLNNNPILLEQLFQFIKGNKPLLDILNLPGLWVLFPHSLLQIKLINVSKRLGELGILKPDRKVLIAIHSRPILLLDALFVNFLQDSIPVRNCRNEDTIDEQVGKDRVEASLEPFFCPKHVVETELCRHHIIIAVIDLKVQVLLGKILNRRTQPIRLVQLIPPLLVLLDTLGTEICRHHIINPAQPPLKYILSPATANIKHVQQLVEPVAFGQVELLFDPLAHVLAVYVHQDGLDPVVEGVAFE